ncbi:MAG TPA: PQQ-binding-like beta-propeller repeat protein [Actinoplanes sp.]|nr:PQQ-binding-like beta-propeller repeat protein [Actinoplanes sp.]
MSRRLTAVLLVLALGGCLGGPDKADLRGGGPLVERWRIPSPVAGWVFADPLSGLIGQGRRLASVDTGPGRLRWVHDLPPGFTVTASSVSVAGNAVLVRGTGRFRVLDRTEGTVLWEREFTGQVAAEEEGDAVVTADCDRRGCDLTGWELRNGQRRWSRHVGDRVRLVSGEQPCYCLFLLGRRTVVQIGTEAGRIGWTMRKPAGVTGLIAGHDRQVLWTPPAEPDCVATLRGITGGTVDWTRDVTTDCGLPMPSTSDDPGYGVLELPVRDGLATLNLDDGQGRTIPLDEHERLVGGGPSRITWTAEVGYRSIDDPQRTPARVPPPAGGRPWAQSHRVGMWLLRSGPGLVLYDPLSGAVRWRGPEPVLIPDHDRLVYLDGPDLVGIGPRDGAVKA